MHHGTHENASNDKRNTFIDKQLVVLNRICYSIISGSFFLMVILNFLRIPPCGAGANVAKYEDTVPVKTLPVPGQSSAKQFYQFSYQLPSISGLYTFIFQCTPKYGRVFCIMASSEDRLHTPKSNCISLLLPSRYLWARLSYLSYEALSCSLNPQRLSSIGPMTT